MKAYSTYIFDLDGTLLNTLDDLTIATNYALRECGMPEHSDNDILQFVGNGIRQLMIRAVPDGEQNPQFDKAFDTFQAYYLEHALDHTRPYPGVTETLRELKARGKRLAVVSNKYYMATQELVKHFFGDIIHVAIGEHEAAGIRKKPAPDTVEEALWQLGTGKENAIYVGDSEVDIMTARNSNIPCISVLWGFRSKDFLIKNGAAKLISNPKELLNDSFEM